MSDSIDDAVRKREFRLGHVLTSDASEKARLNLAMARIAQKAAKAEELSAAVQRLCNQAALLVYHAEGFPDGGLGAFATAREFTKGEINRTRKLLEEFSAL